MNLGDRRDNGARIPRGRVLFDGNGGGESVNLLDIGLAQAVEELAGVGRKGLHITALSLGVKRIKGEGRLATPRQARHDRQGIARNRHINAA